MLMKTRYYLVLPLFLIFALSVMGCSGNDEKRLRYLESQTIPALTMPAGLKQPHSVDALPVVIPTQGSIRTDAKPPSMPGVESKSVEPANP